MGKGKWQYHFLIVIVVIGVDLFGDFVYRGPEGFSGFQYQRILNNTALFIAFFSTYAINYSVVCPNTISKNRIFLFIVSVFILFIVFAGIRFFLDEIVIFSITGTHNYFLESRQLVYYIFDNSYYALKAILFSTLLYVLFRYLANKDRIHQLELEHKKAQLSHLKSQLEPHFLFNTLNTFYTELIDTQPGTAKDIHRLSGLLRYVTYEAQQDFMPLNKEIKFIEDYIYFYRKRYEDYLCLDYRVEGQIGEQKIPSLVLIHFVENIFKHGITDSKENPAKIAISVTSENISITTENLISSSEKYHHKGIGSENLERRLFAIYQHDFTLKYEQENRTFKASLSMPIK